jgi:predicted transcriptional regulator
MFLDIPKFSNYTDAAIFMFSSSLGSFDFSVFENEVQLLDKEYGYIYLTLFLIISNITLLNFLIAILSNTYTILQATSKVQGDRKICHSSGKYFH